MKIKCNIFDKKLETEVRGEQRYILGPQIRKGKI